MRKLKEQKGFTGIELMVVVGIMGIIFAASYGFMSQGIKDISGSQMDRVEQRQEARNMLQDITEEIRRAQTREKIQDIAAEYSNERTKVYINDSNPAFTDVTIRDSDTKVVLLNTKVYSMSTAVNDPGDSGGTEDPPPVQNIDEILKKYLNYDIRYGWNVNEPGSCAGKEKDTIIHIRGKKTVNTKYFLKDGKIYRWEKGREKVILEGVSEFSTTGYIHKRINYDFVYIIVMDSGETYYGPSKNSGENQPSSGTVDDLNKAILAGNYICGDDSNVLHIYTGNGANRSEMQYWFGGNIIYRWKKSEGKDEEPFMIGVKRFEFEGEREVTGNGKGNGNIKTNTFTYTIEMVGGEIYNGPSE